MNRNSPEFKKLQSEWYKKLKDSGFEDAERNDGTDNLREWSSRFSHRRGGATYEEKKVYYESREEFFRLAGHFLHDHKFKNAYERSLWELYSEGNSLREIAALINKKLRKTKIDFNDIYAVIKKLQKLMVSQCLKKRS